MQRPSLAILATVVVVAMVVPAAYFVGLEAGQKAQVRQLDCAFGKNYASRIREIQVYLFAAHGAFDVKAFSEAGSSVNNAIGSIKEARGIALEAGHVLNSSSWRTLVSLDPSEGWVPLRDNLVVKRSLGGARFGPVVWEELLLVRGSMLFRALQQVLERSGFCPSSLDLGKFPASLVSTDLLGDFQTEIYRINSLASEYALVNRSEPVQSARWVLRVDHAGELRLFGVTRNPHGDNRSMTIVTLIYDGSGYLRGNDSTFGLPFVVSPGGEFYFSSMLPLPAATNSSLVALRLMTRPVPPVDVLRATSLRVRGLESREEGGHVNISGKVDNPTPRKGVSALIGIILLDANGDVLEMSRLEVFRRKGGLGLVRVVAVPAGGSAPFWHVTEPVWTAGATVYLAFAWATFEP